MNSKLVLHTEGAVTVLGENITRITVESHVPGMYTEFTIPNQDLERLSEAVQRVAHQKRYQRKTYKANPRN